MIANVKILRALMEVPYHKTLIAMAMWIAIRVNHPLITSAYRPEKVHDEDSGIHMTIPCRALDWESRRLQDPQAVCDDVNNHFEYDPRRPKMKCAIYHQVGKLGWHIHTQVHDRTIYYKDGKHKEVKHKEVSNEQKA